ncbi:hypothetical protein [Nocardia sp. NPDC050412]|uniref:hypothetical protein n=1 Tax=Nocardia sp. NPDC050412 TaxID=3364320 RepID=UPI0037B1B648
MDIDAVIVPSADHFGGTVPEELVKVRDVITTSPENTYARWAIPSPSLPVGGM